MLNTQDEQFNNSDVLSEVEKAAELFHLLGDYSRLKIYLLIVERERSVTEIVELTHLTQSNVSHHLKLLKAKDLVSSKRQGKLIIYMVDKELSLSKSIIKIVQKML